MNSSFIRGNAKRIAALGIVTVLYGFARLPSVSEKERAQLASRFAFSSHQLLSPGGQLRNVRRVHPSLQHISAWISSVGAAAALTDLDGDGLSNDLCWVDVRTDQVMVAPVPGTGARFAPQVLDPAPLPYDAKTMAPMGCLPGDVDGDGRIDLLVYFWGRTPIIYLNRPAGFHAAELVDSQPRWFTNSGVFADLDGDGHADLVISNYFPDGSRILDADNSEPQQMQHSMSRAFNGGRKHVFLWTGPGKYREVPDALEEKAAVGWTLATGAADLDGDLLPELYLANDFGPDHLLHNRSTPGHLKFALVEGERKLTTPASKVLGRDSFKGMGVDFGDLNGDGHPDIFVSNIAAPYALEESHFLFLSTGKLDLFRKGIAPYVDSSESLGVSRSSWGWDARMADFDNDGTMELIQASGFSKGRVNRWPELHEVAMANDQLLQNPAFWHHFEPGDDLSGTRGNPFYVRAADGRYYDISDELGLADPYITRGIAIGDVDGDGRLDYVIANQWGPSFFLHNDSPHAGAFLELRIVDSCGSPVIGARGQVLLPDGKKLVSAVDGGSGHSGKRSPDLHFGLGAASPTQPVEVAVEWRDNQGVHEQRQQLLPGRHTVILGRKGN